MVIYEVTALVAPDLVQDYEHFMREHHIPAVLATGCFQRAAFTRADPDWYRMRYEALSSQDLERYLASHAPALREDFTSRFPEGVTLSRQVWVVLQGWDV
jgi:hypothetical protein